MVPRVVVNTTLVSKYFSFGTSVFRPYKENIMEKITGLDYKIKEMAGRIKELREIEGLTVEEMAIKNRRYCRRI